LTHKQRALAAMRGRPVDHVPFIARMELWYNYNRNAGTLPARFRHATLWELQRELDVGIFGFGVWEASYFRLEYRGVELETEHEDGITTTRYVTPYGTLASRDRMADELKEAAGTGARVEYPFRGAQDFDALQYLFDHAVVVDDAEAYCRFVDSIGEDGIALPFTGTLPAHQLMLSWMGYEGFYYAMADHPARVERLIGALTERQREILALARRCPADAIEVGANYDEHITPPPVFASLFAPFYREARATLEAAGKILVIHGDGDMDGLLPMLRDCGIQVVEALTPAPMTGIRMRRVRQEWEGAVTLWGGLASVALTRAFTEEEFEAYLEDLFDAVAPGDRFILGFGDNVPTDALFHRVEKTVDFWKRRGRYPLRKGRTT